MADFHEGNHHGGDANSQVLGSNVLVYTEGDADMTFALSFAPPGRPGANSDEYHMHPTFCTRLGAGTLLVFSPTDDLFFCHEAWLEDGAGTHRLAFVFRWLSQPRDFFQSNDAMKLAPALKGKEACAKKQKQKKLSLIHI